ncbi:MAG: hypothetical protein IIB00_09360, partial [candidate division Zixibacteria bacterium]|nr:hypothetical protein [candidate division Zixibacteria bacterium]
ASPPSGVSGEFITSTAVSSYLQDKMDAVANAYTDVGRLAKLGLMNTEKSVTLAEIDSYDASSRLSYKAAVIPDVISVGLCGDIGGVVSPLPGDRYAPGDVADITLCVNGPAVTRGAHDLYATICTNDPDYFLNDSTGAECPEITLRLVGGCLQDSVILTFGIAGANSIICFNNGFDQGFRNAGNNSYNVDGYTALSDFGELFDGWRWWGISQHRMAMTGFPLSFGAPFWENVAADPNFCTNTCRPAHLTNQLLTEMSFDNGASYTPVFGEIAAASWIDSARDFAPPNGTGTWNWNLSPVDYLPDSTIGLSTRETFYGAHDVLALASFRLMRAEISIRDQQRTDTIFGLRAGSMHDNDNGFGGFGNEKMVGDVASSVAHWYDPAAPADKQVAAGYIKVPFGCGADGGPIRARAADGPQFLYSANQMDSLFPWASLPQYAGITAQAGMAVFESGADDFEGVWTFGNYDIAPGDGIELAVADFTFTSLSPPSSVLPSGLVDASIFDQFNGLADLVNKYAGYGRGDVNNDLTTDLADVLYLSNHVNGSGPGPFPFKYTGDMNDDGNVDQLDVLYLLDYYLCLQPCAPGAFELPNCSVGP